MIRRRTRETYTALAILGLVCLLFIFGADCKPRQKATVAPIASARMGVLGPPSIPCYNGNSGSNGATIVAISSITTFTDATAASFTPGMVGQTLTVTGGSHPAHSDGTFIIQAYTSATVISIYNFNSVIDTALSWQVSNQNADPNNCGACGTICGTYGPNPTPVNTNHLGRGLNQNGVSFIQGTCTNAVCSPYVATSLPATGGLDCWDIPSGNVIGGTTSFTPVCVSVLNSSQNCGGLGVTCQGPCVNTNCEGMRTVPPTLVLTAGTPTAAPEALSATGGVSPYSFGYAAFGNVSGGSIVGNTYTPGTAALVDVVIVTDSVGNVAQFSITTS